MKDNSRIKIINIKDGVGISVKIKKFPFSSVALTFCLAALLLTEIFLIYRIFVISANLPFLLPVLIILTIGIVLLMRIWLWNIFGEEFVEAKSNNLLFRKSYGLFAFEKRYFGLKGSIDLYVNKSDNWNWAEFRQKGVFRVGNESQIFDFGINLNENEYEMLLPQMNNLLKKFSEKHETTEMSNKLMVKNKAG